MKRNTSLLPSIPIFLLALFIAGCETVSPYALSPEQYESLKITTINVSVADDAFISWGQKERDYAEAIGLKEPKIPVARQFSTREQTAERSRLIKANKEFKERIRVEGRPFIVEAIENDVKAALEKRFAEEPAGDTAAKIDVTIMSFRVSSAGQAFLVGGSDGIMRGVATLSYEESGEFIGEYDVTAIDDDGVSGFVGAVSNAATGGRAGRVLGRDYSNELRRQIKG